ncbi:thioredoxin-dependent thiol peroxidase [Enemella dayhoffiae]|uniref:thioredoxin-dependent peroxiredoxin n=1 Tax=Enemella dayhoffiae TaxID=2016507 RepID=A0A255GZ31_9ACTN|nr:thioredoxin-dependent thiol peroxidase [Enemella dayhoffiae]OYO20860.1 thioredoxin-dependent thiol peroxidase [Enemella dayhoffiae]
MNTRLEAGDAAPAFTLTDSKGDSVSLADHAGRRVVVYFYPAAMTPGCTTQAIDFTAAMKEFEGAGVDVLGISPDKPEKLAKFADKESIAFPLLSDPDRSVMDAYGAYGTKTMYGKQVQGVIRSTFVVDVDGDGKGTISLAQHNVRATGHVERLRREIGV